MVDPNRKINLPTDEDSSSEEDVLNEEHVKMVKEYEEEFRDRFTEHDEEFTKFCEQPKKPPIIVFPFDNFHRHNHHHHHHRGFNRRPRPYDSHKYPRYSGGGPKYNNNYNRHYGKN